MVGRTMGRAALPSLALLIGLLMIARAASGQEEEKDEIAVPVDPRLNCTENSDAYDVLSFLVRANSTDASNGTGAANVTTVLPGPGGALYLRDLCALQGVVCLDECKLRKEDNLLDSLCTFENGTDVKSFLDHKYGEKVFAPSPETRENVATALISYCVTGLYFGGRGLQGSLGTVSGLRNLQELNLTKNAITGSFADLSNMTKLEMIDLSLNNIQGTLEGLSSDNLTYLYASLNAITGSLAPLAALSSLEILDLKGNMIEGFIDPLTLLVKLQNIFLSDNRLRGNIDAIQNMTNLLYIDVKNNNLSGSLPQLQKPLDRLAVLLLSNNTFTKVGNALQKMKGLQLVDLSLNQFNDNINELLSLSSNWMGALDLRSNNFQGYIATDALDSLPILELFFLTKNPQLRGRLTPNLGTFNQFNVETTDQFIYYAVDSNVFTAMEMTASQYFKINNVFISLDPTCNGSHMNVSTTQPPQLQQVQIPKDTKLMYLCFIKPRGKFMINSVTRVPMKFNMSYHTNMDACGTPLALDGSVNGMAKARDVGPIPIAIPVFSCDKSQDTFISDRVFMTLSVKGEYDDGSLRGYRQNYNFAIEVQQDSSTSFKNNSALYISLITIFSVGALALAIFIWTTLSIYLSFQKQQKYYRMKKNAESAFVKARKEARLQTEKDSCVVFTDIQSSTVLRDTSSQLYNEIILVHDGIIRKLAAKLGGLELATEGDGFVLWFESVPCATIFCMELQEELMATSWSPKVLGLCESAYRTHSSPSYRSFGNQKSSRSQDSSSSEKAGCYRGFQKEYIKLLLNKNKEKSFNGPRVRCGIHVMRAGENTIEKLSLGIYSFSGPDFEIGRMVCDMGHGGQILVSGPAQSIILDNLNESQFPQIWHWGGYTFDDEDNKEIHHIYEVAPSQGVLKSRNFDGLRGRIQLAYPPGVHFSNRELPTKDAIIVCATAKDSNLSRAAFDIADGLISDMQQRFWGWRIVPEDLVRQSVSPSDPRLKRPSMRSSRTASDASSPVGVQSMKAMESGAGLFRIQDLPFNQNDVTKKWFFAFAKPEDALRFALCCQLELLYAQWPRNIRKTYKKELTAEKAPLWQGLSVAFAIHVCNSPSFDHGRLLELVPQSSFRMKSPCKQNLKLCNPSKHNVLNTTRSTVSETMSILDNISLDGQVVVTSKFIQSMNVPISSIGDPVVEHLGRVAVKEFKNSVDVYQVLPVELAARRFPALCGRLSTGHLMSVGARSAPQPKIGLSFVFMYTVSSISCENLEKEANQMFSSDSIFDGDQLQLLLTKYRGYLVDEVSMSNMVFAFESTCDAVCFCSTIQRALAICKWKQRGDSNTNSNENSFELSENAPSNALDAVNLLKDKDENSKNLKIGIASIESQSEVHDVFLGIDSTTGRRRYGTPVLNMASRVAKSARCGQILMVGRNPGTNIWDSAKNDRLMCEMDDVMVIKHGFYKLRGFGEKPKFVYEVRSAEGMVSGLLQSTASNLDSDYMEYMSTSKLARDREGTASSSFRIDGSLDSLGKARSKTRSKSLKQRKADFARIITGGF